MNTKDWTGQKYGRLTFIAPTHKRKQRLVVWEAQCECGNTAYVSPTNAKSGNVSSCGCYRTECLRAHGRKIGNRGFQRIYEPKISSAMKVWKRIYAPRKGDDGCDFDTFLRLSQEDCYYCGRGPHRTYNVGAKPSSAAYELQMKNGNFTYNGLDRVDNSKGHTRDNVVPCCTTCNSWKKALGIEEFLSHIERIYNNRVKPTCTPRRLLYEPSEPSRP